MKSNHLIDLYSKLKKSLFETDFEVYQDLHYEQNGMHYYIDLAIMRDNAVMSFIEFKDSIQEKGSRTELYIKQCNVYRRLFPNSKPFVFLTDGNNFYEVFENNTISDNKGFSDIIGKIKEIQPICEINNSSFDSFLDKLKESKEQKGKMMDFVSEIKKECEKNGYNQVFKSHKTYFCFNDEYEKKFFKTLLGSVKRDFYRYMPLEILRNTLSEKRQAFASILCMNDETECYYSQNYVDKRMIGDFMTIDKTEAYAKGSRCFIMSCTSNSDENMEMWDEYGNKAQGVRVCFDAVNIDNDSSFLIAPVNYSKESGDHPILNLIADILKEKYNGVHYRFENWEAWQHFFKPHEYEEEKEIRILYQMPKEQETSEDIKWVYKNNLIFPLVCFKNHKGGDFPLTIKEIMLGPVAGNMDKNVATIKQMLNINDIKISGEDIDDIVIRSKYRR